ncbi:MAG: helix-turn-helix domain-containing protein [Cephaloticoccus sp.]
MAFFPGLEFVARHRGRVRCEPGWHLGRSWAHGLRDCDLWFVWEGRGRMVTSDGELRLRPGVCLWMRPGRHYEAVQDPAARLGVNYIHFGVRRAGKDLPLSAFDPPFEVLRSRQVEFVDAVMRRIVELDGDGAEATAANALLGGLLTELAREHAAARHQPTPGTEQRHRDLVLEVAGRIRESPAQAPAVADLARQAGYSVDHFSRVFQKVTGLRPQDYVINARIERARQLLAESDLTIGGVAENVGFQDIFYFSRQFRQKTGQTPTEFRRGLRAG